MNINGFTEQQRQALLDLAVLGMYADGHLASAEDARVQRLLAAMGVASEPEKNRAFDAAVARVRRHAATPATAAAHANELSGCFTTYDHRRQLHDVLNDLITCDHHVALGESAFLAAVRERFQP